jgi:tetratricopeptide (TPR) repeat protein
MLSESELPTLGSEFDRRPKKIKIMPPLKILRLTPAVILFLAVFVLSCHKTATKAKIPAAKPQPAATTPTDFEQGEARYAAGNYAEAAFSYETYLKFSPAKDRALALYHLGLAYALQGATPENLEKSQGILQQLVDQYPDSPHLSEAKLLLSLHGEIKRLGDATIQMQAEINGNKAKQAEMDKLKNEIKEQQAKIKSLSEDLQRLRDIDMDRRPSRPSR